MMTEKESRENDFSDSSVFRALPQQKRDEITRALKTRVVAPGTTIVRQGDPGDSFYIVHSGKIRVFRRDKDGMETDLSILGPGDSFGEMALLTGEPRSANAETLEETRLTVLSKDEFDRILKDYPDLSLAFVKQMSRWLVRDEKLIEKEAQQAYRAPRLAWFDFPLLIGVSLVLAIVFNQSNPNGIPLFPKFPDRKSFAAVSPMTAMEEQKNGEAIIVDAGPANFYEQKHIKGSVSLPLSVFDILYMMTLAGENKEKKIIIYGGTISKPYDLELASKLALRGHKNVSVLEGGLSAWEEKGYPIEEQKKEQK
jgi:rhodanese-related sulfurtransferase